MAPRGAAATLAPVRTGGGGAQSRRLALLLGLALPPGLALACSAPTQGRGQEHPPAPPSSGAPVVIAHRGASGSRPEHTLEAYLLAIQQGADFIEPDLVTTRDGVLIARHENVLASVVLDAEGQVLLEGGSPVVHHATTDVAERPAFRDLLTVKQVSGRRIGGWFSEDFTLAEVKQLRARERLPELRPQNARLDGQLEVPTLGEILLLVQLVEEHTGRRVGIYPETKSPTHFASSGRRLDGSPIGISTSRLLVEALVEAGFTDPARVYIQSFEVRNLLQLQYELMPAAGIDLPLVQLLGDLRGGRPADLHHLHGESAEPDELYRLLLDALPGSAGEGTYLGQLGYGTLATPRGLAALASTYAEGIGPAKEDLLPRERLAEPVDADGDGKAELRSRLRGEVTDLLGDARACGLEVHPYTLRAEERFLALGAEGRPQPMEAEAQQLLSLGVTGFFTDHPGRGVRARDDFLESQDRPRPVRAPVEEESWERVREELARTLQERATSR